ncbi:uncharacterized protein LOC102352955 [Latimeria chalumnae]|uniref:uncharacterized protein LOC102352955 n=1 Tax=Latimeria chalumnae TaxID=7897 RepID=UPI00313DA51D
MPLAGKGLVLWVVLLSVLFFSQLPNVQGVFNYLQHQFFCAEDSSTNASFCRWLVSYDSRKLFYLDSRVNRFVPLQQFLEKKMEEKNSNKLTFQQYNSICQLACEYKEKVLASAKATLNRKDRKQPGKSGIIIGAVFAAVGVIVMVTGLIVRIRRNGSDAAETISINSISEMVPMS